MAEVSYLHLPETVEDYEYEQEEILAFDSVFPYCSHVFCTDSDSLSLNDHHIHQATEFYPETYDRIGGLTGGASGSSSFEEILDRENQVTFVMDLFQQRVEQSRTFEIGSFELDPILESDFGLVERNSAEEIGGHSLELEIGEVLGFGAEFDRNRDLGYGVEEDDNFGGFIVSDCGNEFYVSRRESGNNTGGSSNGGDEINRFSGGLNVVSFESDSEEDVSDLLVTDLHLEDDYASPSGNDDGNLTLCWDSLQLEDHRDANDDFEWEEVDDGLDALNPEGESISILPIIGPQEDEIEERQQGRSRNLEWEVLLNVNNLERNPMMENNEGPYLGELDGYIYTADEEMTFGQFAEDEDAPMDRPPASRLVVRSLPSVTITESDVQKGNALCAVCKDEMGIGEQVKQLPCSHCYHGDCIFPWLEIRNSCPVCRHELPTDDPDYEQRRIRRAARDQ